VIPASHWHDNGDGKLPQRVIDKISVDSDGCWNWTASLTADGYGHLWWQGTMTTAHRTVYELTAGALPDGMVLDHLCRNRRCVNPDHMRVVTRKQNSLENSESVTAVNAAKTHCHHGHALDMTYPDGRRWCRTCKRMSDTRSNAKRKVQS
jgi:hypothetical protein